MKRIRSIGANSGALGSPKVRLAGQAIAYLGVPLSIVAGPTIESPLGILVCGAIIAMFGLAAVLRGAKVPDLVLRVAYFFLGWYVILTLIELFNGDLTRFPRPVTADFLMTYFVLLAFPFFVIGLREVRAERAALEWAMTGTILAGTLWSLVSFFLLGTPRPGGFNALNPITFGMILLLWSLFLMAGALAKREIDWVRLVPPLVAVIPVILTGSKLVWLCMALGYGVLLVWWAIATRRWIALGVSAIGAVLLGAVLLQTPFVRNRLGLMLADVTAFMATGDTTGASFGIRLAAASSGFFAFLDRPLFGYGLADVKIAALGHRPEHFADFSYLWHLHNQYITHLVAFGVAGLLFLLSLLATLVYVGVQSMDTSIKRFAVVAALACAGYMCAELFFPRTPLYGTFFYLLALCLLVATRDQATTTPAAVPA